MSSKHIVARQVTGSTTSYVPLLDIPAASGELKSLGVSDGIEYHSFRVTIDGTTLADAYLSGTASGSVRSNTGLAIALRFEQSLLVQVSGSVLSPQTTYWAVASTDSSEFTNRTTFTQSIEGAPYLFERLTYGREDGTEYDVTMPIGPDQISKIILDEGVPIPGEQVTGYIELRSVIGEKRFALPQDWLTATLREYFYRRDIPGPPYPAPYGPYVEIAADLPGYANYPASIVLW